MTKIINPEHGDIVLDNLNINARKMIENHTLPMDVVFYLLEGELEFIVDNNKINLKSFEVIEVKAFQKRTVFNKTDNDAKLLVMKQI